MSISLLLVFLVGIAFAQDNDCSSKDSCSDCISTAFCTWCSTPGATSCSSIKTTCNPDDLIQPASEVLQANDLTLNEDNQISLKDISVKLRIGEPLSFTVSVQAAEDFPLDMYVLMDLSFSFEGDLQTVKSLAPQLPLTLRSVASDFLIGFGAYIDKPILPFTSTVQINEYFTHQGMPSSCAGTVCAAPFAYEHFVDLTNSSTLFDSSVQESNVSANVDNPEGTLDAMLQAVVCEDIIGWREKSRKLLLVMTDDVIHTAGDGTLAGIVKPNDGLCHTEYDPSVNKTLYTAALTQDYPSIELVKQSLLDGNIVPIFAVAGTNALQFYQDTIVTLLGGFALRLTENSDNLEEVLQEAYSNVVSKAGLNFILPDYLSANITANCPGNSTYIPENYECSNISNGTAEFIVSLTLTSCTKELQNGNFETVLFSVPGFGTFQVDVRAHCSCDCENETVHQSPHCSNNGVFSCGLCECNEGWSGPLCSCSTAMCPLGPNRVVCSGRGECQCGQCVCSQPPMTVPGVDNPRIEGDACECSNYECDTGSEGMVCSGRGTCTCSNSTYTCQCNTSPLSGLKYSGDSCQCSPDNCVDTSVPGELCNGRGTCDPCQSQGSSCRCNTGYIGEYCNLAYSGAPLCNGNEDCVKCYAKSIKSGNDPTVSCSHLSCIDYRGLSNSQDASSYNISNSIDESTQDCSFSTVECQYIYYVAISLNSTIVYEAEPEVCLLLPVWAIALIIVVGLLIIGILILVLIKLIFKYQDYREYKKFVYEVKQSEQTRQENPVYLNPVTQTVNPVHGKAL